jgi:hypothetical protein
MTRKHGVQGEACDQSISIGIADPGLPIPLAPVQTLANGSSLERVVSHAYNESRVLTRRRFLQGAAYLTVSSALSGCGYHSDYLYTPASGNLLPTPSGPVVQGSLTVTATSAGIIPSRFMGLSYEKEAISYSYFHPSNHNLIALFRRPGNGVLRIGGGSVDQVLWTG